MTSLDEMSDEDRDREYLQEHPAYELSLWQDWVITCCHRLGMASPTAAEWDALTKNWYHGKMPLTSADELQAMRKATS